MFWESDSSIKLQILFFVVLYVCNDKIEHADEQYFVRVWGNFWNNISFIILDITWGSSLYDVKFICLLIGCFIIIKNEADFLAYLERQGLRD